MQKNKYKIVNTTIFFFLFLLTGINAFCMESESEIEIDSEPENTNATAAALIHFKTQNRITLKQYPRQNITPKTICKICKNMYCVHALPRHMKDAHNLDNNMLISCDVCNKQVYEFSLGRHKAQCHTTHSTKNYYFCKFCSGQYTSLEGLRSHNQAIHNHKIERNSYIRKRLKITA